jgi:hypothetical protein
MRGLSESSSSAEEEEDPDLAAAIAAVSPRSSKPHALSDLVALKQRLQSVATAATSSSVPLTTMSSAAATASSTTRRARPLIRVPLNHSPSSAHALSPRQLRRQTSPHYIDPAPRHFGRPASHEHEPADSAAALEMLHTCATILSRCAGPNSRKYALPAFALCIVLQFFMLLGGFIWLIVLSVQEHSLEKATPGSLALVCMTKEVKTSSFEHWVLYPPTRSGQVAGCSCPAATTGVQIDAIEATFWLCVSHWS